MIKLRSFTLIEFLLVIIITAILITVSLPHLKHTFDDFLLNNFSNELQLFFTYLKDRSIVEGRIIVLQIDNENQRLLSHFKDEPKVLRVLALPKGISLQSSKKEVFFYPDGQIDGLTLKVVNTLEHEITLTTIGVFGGIKIFTQG